MCQIRQIRHSLYHNLAAIVDIEALPRGLINALAAEGEPLVVTVIGYCFTVIVLDARGFIVAADAAEDDRHGLRLEFSHMAGARHA